MHDSWDEVKISKLATVLLEWCLGGVQDFSGGGAAGAEVTARTAEVEPEDVTGLLQPCPSFTSWELLSTDEQRQWFKMESTPGEEAVKTVKMTTEDSEHEINSVDEAVARSEKTNSNFASSNCGYNAAKKHGMLQRNCS